MAIVLADNTPRIEYTVAQGVTQTVFPIPFAFFNKEDSSNVDVKVFVDGVERTLGSISTTTFSITSGGDGAKGSLSTTVTGASGGSTVIVLRDTKIGRTTDFPSGGAFEVSKLNTELDTLVAIEGDFEDHVSRSIRLQDKDTAVSLALPLKADRLGKQLGFNATTGAVQMFTPESLAIASDSGSSSVDLTSNTFTFTGGEGIDTSISNQTLTITGELASTSNKGVASFNSTNFTVSSGAVTANDITLASDSGSATNTLGETFTLSGGTGLNTSATGSTVTMNVDAAQTGITSLLATDIKIGEDDQTKIDFETANQINFYANNVNVVQLSNTNSGDAVFTVPTSDKDFVIKGNDGGSTITALTIDMSNSGDASFNNNVTVGGNLTVNGSSTTVNTATLTVEDPLISLASGNNSADSVDVGFYGLYDTSGSQDLYAGLFRDASDSGKFKLFKDLQVEPTTTVNTGGTGYAVGTLVANLEGNVNGTLDNLDSTQFLRSDTDDTLTATLTTVTQYQGGSTALPSIIVKGGGPNIIRFIDGDNASNLTNGVDLAYRTGPNDLLIERTNGNKIAEFGGDDGHAALYFDNSKKLETTSGGIEVTGTVTDDGATHDGDVTFTGTSGNIVFDKSDDSLKFADNVKAKFGTGVDLQIYHDGSDSYIQETGVGNLIIRSSDFRVRTADNTAFILRGSTGGDVRLFYNGSQKFKTQDTGATVTGTLVADGISVGDSETISVGASDDLQISHVTGNNNIVSANSPLYLKTNSSNGVVITKDSPFETMAKFIPDGAVELYYNNEKNFETHLDGITVGGDKGILQVNGTNTTIGTTVAGVHLYADGFRERGFSIFNNALGESGLVEEFFMGVPYGDSAQPFVIKTNDQNETAIKINQLGSVELYHNNVKVFETEAFGFKYSDANVTTQLGNQSNFGVLELGGSSGAFIDLKGPATDDYDFRLFTSGTEGVIATDDLHLKNKAQTENYLDATVNGAVNLYYDNSKKFETTSTGATVTGDLELVSTDAGASAGPTLALYRNSASPAGSDDIGQIQFFAENNADEKIEYGRIDVRNAGVTDGQEYGQMDFTVMQQGSHISPLRISFNLVQVFKDLYLGANTKIKYEGSAYNDFETNLTFTGPTADRTITLPDASGTVLLDTGNQTLTGDLTFPDNEEIKIGTDGDLRIYHNGSNSYIDEGTGTGALIFKSQVFSFRNAPDSQQMAIFNQGGNCRFFHNGAEKLQTLSDGAKVFGDLTIVNSDDDANANPSLIIDRGSSSPADNDDIGEILFRGRDSGGSGVDYVQLVTDVTDVSDTTEDAQFLIKVMEGGTLTQYASFNGGGGQIYFARKLNMQSNQILGVSSLELLSTDAATSSAPLLELYRHSASPAADDFLGRIDFYGEDDNDDKVRYASITSSIMQPTNGNERGRLELDLMQNGSMITFLEMAANTISLNKPTNISNTLSIVSTEDGGPILTLRSNDPGDVADFNTEGIIKYNAENSANEEITYAQVKLLTDDVTDGTEDGRLVHSVMKNGTLTDILHMTSTDFMLMNTTPLVWYQPHGTSFITTLNVTSPTAHRSILLPDLAGTVALTSQLSDIRDKKDIEDLQLGLDFVNAMRPVQFTWDRRDGSYNDVKELGFIAQELDQVERQFDTKERTKLVTEMSEDELHVSPMNSYPILVKAIQELSAQVESLQARVKELEG